MTNQEAITKLTNIMHDDHYAWSPAILTAFNMAVDALKGADAQPTQTNTPNALDALDCIDRQAAIELMCRALHYHYEEGYAVSQMMELPSAQPEQRWMIPCGKCIHADGKHRWCKVLDRTINEDYFCYWAEPFREEGEADG